MSPFLDRAITLGTLATAGMTAGGAPVIEAWPYPGPGAASATAGAGLSGVYAVASTETDTIEVRGIRGELLTRIERAELESMLPWATLSADGDGPSALALSDSGRLLFAAVHDDEPAPDGFGGDAILRFDLVLGTAAVFTRTELSDVTTPGADPGVALTHHAGVLYAGGADAMLRAHAAGKDATFSILPQTTTLDAPVRGLAVDRDLGLVYALTGGSLWRGATGPSPAFAFVGLVNGGTGLATGPAVGNAGAGDLFISRAAGDSGEILRVPNGQAIGLSTLTPSLYAAMDEPVSDLDATACGRLLVADDAGARIVSDDADARLGFEAWVRDEFTQVAAFVRGLIAPDGEPEGWVIDADVRAGGARFHPATPDGAAWAVLVLLMDEHLNGAPDARALVRAILTRYAGLASDGIAPVRSADGIYKHWIDPLSGQTKAGWLDEFATLSTMKIVLAADRARRFYPTDPVIGDAADAIIGGVTNWGTYIDTNDALYFKGAAGGGPFGGASLPFHEGIIFVEQAEAFGAVSGVLDRWLQRSRWPSASFAAGMPVTVNSPGRHLPAFVSLYSALVQEPLRSSPAWVEHLDHLLGSHAAWTDDAGPRFMTVFSAGSTAPQWGGYNADSLSDHPGDVTTFPSLMAFSRDGRTAPAVGAYEAYRRGARQAFAGGASILYRRSDELPGFTFNDAGLPDVALGALGLAELIEAGSVGAVLAGAYNDTGCPADLAPPFGVLDLADINAFVASFVAGGTGADLAEPFGVLDLSDINAFIASFVDACP
jgi:hypothetical protein